MEELKINLERTSERIIRFIQQTINGAGFRKAIIAVSGGVDSATTLALAKKALGKENVLVALLPYKDLNRNGIENAKRFLLQLKIPAKNIFQVNIKPTVDKIAGELDKIEKSQSLDIEKTQLSIDKIRIGNIMARVRMIILYDLAKKHKALICGTENKSEYLLGYFTRFGDEASDLEPIRNLYKTQLYQIAKYLRVPKKIINSPPTAGLWEDQTDEGELGFSYKDADIILHLLFDKKTDIQQVVKKGYSLELVKRVKTQVEKNRFKHKTPYVLEI